MNLSPKEFKLFQDFLLKEVGISLADHKLDMLQSRLYSRLQYHQIESYSQYLDLVTSIPDEKIEMINQITTNETYFFRESQHFEFLTELIKHTSENLLAKSMTPLFRVWSAASSVGAEAYSIAMILDDNLGIIPWQIYGTDINTEVINTAKTGLYSESWLDKIPAQYKSKYCLKGKGQFSGKFLIDRKLTEKVHFEHHNLIHQNTNFGQFDIIFLRNILIYCNSQTKQKVLDNNLAHLAIGGYLFIGLTENLEGLTTNNLIKIQSSIYQKLA